MESPSHHEDWRAWFRQHGPRLLLVARLWTRNLADAEDVLQEAFVRYWRSQRQLGGDPSPLLVTSIKRAAVDRQRSEERRARREQDSGLVIDETRDWFQPGAGEGERESALQAAIGTLPAEQREVLVLRIWGELGFAELAAQLGIPQNTAASRFRYALLALRKCLGSEAGAEGSAALEPTLPLAAPMISEKQGTVS